MVLTNVDGINVDYMLDVRSGLTNGITQLSIT